MSILEVKTILRNLLKSVLKLDSDTDTNDAIQVYVRDNLPMVAMGIYSKKKPECEFCKEVHGQRDVLCDLVIDKVDANSAEGCKKITVQQILDTMTTKRNLIFAVVISGKNHNYHELKHAYKKFQLKEGENEKGAAITLAECFEAFEEEETLTGTDQWYCRDCKEHRDIHKKLELYKIPKIMILHLRRFRSKRSASNGESGFFNLAYA